MDLVNLVASQDAKKAAAKKADNLRLVFACAAGAETYEDDLIKFVYVDSVGQLLTLEQGPVALVFSEEHLRIAACLKEFHELFGLDVAVIEGVPGQIEDPVFAETMYGVERVSYHRVIGDLVEAERRLAMMTEAERAESINALERSRYTRKNGSVKPLINFDHSQPEDEVVEGEVSGG